MAASRGYSGKVWAATVTATELTFEQPVDPHQADVPERGVGPARLLTELQDRGGEALRLLVLAERIADDGTEGVGETAKSRLAGLVGDVHGLQGQSSRPAEVAGQEQRVTHQRPGPGAQVRVTAGVGRAHDLVPLGGHVGDTVGDQAGLEPSHPDPGPDGDVVERGGDGGRFVGGLQDAPVVAGEEQFGGMEGEELGPVAGGQGTDEVEGGVDEPEALLVDLAHDTADPAVVGQNGPDETVAFSLLGGQPGGVEQGLAGVGVAGPALRLAETGEEVDAEEWLLFPGGETEALGVPALGFGVGQHRQGPVPGSQAGPGRPGAVTQRGRGDEVMGHPGGVLVQFLLVDLGGPQVQPGPSGGGEGVVEGGADEGVDEPVGAGLGFLHQAGGQSLLHGRQGIVARRPGDGGERVELQGPAED